MKALVRYPKFNLALKEVKLKQKLNGLGTINSLKNVSVLKLHGNLYSSRTLLDTRCSDKLSKPRQ